MNFVLFFVIAGMLELFESVLANRSPVQDIGDSPKKEKEIKYAEENLFRQLWQQHKKIKALDRRLNVIQYVLKKTTGVAFHDIKPNRDLKNSFARTLWKHGDAIDKKINNLTTEETCILPQILTVCQRVFNEKNAAYFNREKLSFHGNNGREECQEWTMKVGSGAKDRFFSMEFKKCFVTRHLDDGTTTPFIVYVKASYSQPLWTGNKVFIAYAYERNSDDNKWQLKGNDIPGGFKTAVFRFEAYLPLGPPPKLIGQK